MRSDVTTGLPHPFLSGRIEPASGGGDGMWHEQYAAGIAAPVAGGGLLEAIPDSVILASKITNLQAKQ